MLRSVAAILILISALAAVAYYSLREPPLLMNPASEVQLQHEEPDLYGEAVTLTQLRADGTLHYRLYADRIQQFEAGQLTHMQAPQLRLQSTDQPPWDIQSRHGYLRQSKGSNNKLEDVVYLREAVKMVRTHPESGTLTLTSESFYIFPDREYAETDQDVMIGTQVGHTQANGLTLNLQTGLLYLTSHTESSQRVHTIILPEQFKRG